MTAAVLADPAVRAIQDQKVSPGVLGFLVVASLGVATWLLIRSMTRQIHKIDFSEDAIDIERQKSPVPEAETVRDAVAEDGSPEPGRAAAEGDDLPGPGGDLR